MHAPSPSPRNVRTDILSRFPGRVPPFGKLFGGLCLLSGLLSVPAHVSAQESLAPLVEGKAPRNFDELWAGYDPRKEALEAEVLKEWEEEGVVLRVVRFRIGIFKGRKAMMAAVYGFPKGAKGLPGLLNIHGGGQYADHRAPLYNAKRGYATVTIAWAGRISAPGYTVDPKGVALFWEGKNGDPQFRLTTDWGALDAYHAPCRNPKNQFDRTLPEAWTLDAVESPRNNPWFLCTLAGRRALTFLEQQPEVNGDKIGVYGHSMGGKLTVAVTAADSRIKASAPSCGGVSDRTDAREMYLRSVADPANLAQIRVPIFFLMPANDFHGRIQDLQTALGEIKSTDVRMTCSPHHNHQDTETYQVATLLWMDRHLKGGANLPTTPAVSLDLRGPDGIPVFTLVPENGTTPDLVEVFYTQQGVSAGNKESIEDAKSRHWRVAAVEKIGDRYRARIPLFDVERPLWVYGNARYPMKSPVTGVGYYYAPYTASNFILSTRMLTAEPAALKAVGVRATGKPLTVIEDFSKGWEREWFTYDLAKWSRATHKVFDPVWKAPEGARLQLTLKGGAGNTLVVTLDGKAAWADLQGGGASQTIRFLPQDFRDGDGLSLSNWTGLRELKLQPAVNLKAKNGTIQTIGRAWQGPDPVFERLEWVVGDGGVP